MLSMFIACLFELVLTLHRSLLIHCLLLLDLFDPQKSKYNNQDPSPIEYFKETHTNSKTGSMSEPAHLAYNATKKKRETQSEGEQPVSDSMIVVEVLKEESTQSTFLSSMSYASRSERSGTFTSSA
ncbi:hypothetical protein CFC21_041167 [Triticum aestivum]|uniref:Uncharacterized protein n=2 Tax=Triticum aestivum TaxID=4565 RepID=A0A3B6FQ68_WHEAT|nr:hypothetical protein CFC21_041167 [Triticum aestivum]